MIFDELRAVFAERNIKQKDIAKALNLSQSYISELLSGKKVLSLVQFEKLCEFLEIEITLIDKYR